MGNDLDGTVVWYDITKRQGGGGTQKQELHVDTLERLIRDSGHQPVERDTLYRPIVRDGAGDSENNRRALRVPDAPPAHAGVG